VSGTRTAGLAGGSAAGFSAVKAGVVAMCIAGAAGSYAVCQRVGITFPLHLGAQHVRPYYRSPRKSHTVVYADQRHTRLAWNAPVLSEIDQIEREFASRRAELAAAASQPLEGKALPAQSAGSVAQEATEFGFER
jgi:hypothetical protein